MKKNRIYLLISFIFVLVIVVLYIRGCNPTEAFDTSLDTVETNRFQVNCSQEINKNNHGAINDVGYMCDVQLTDETKLIDQAGKTLTVNDFKSGDNIRVILKKRQYITETKREFEASEIILLDKATR
jgi:hypothetical protein